MLKMLLSKTDYKNIIIICTIQELMLLSVKNCFICIKDLGMNVSSIDHSSENKSFSVCFSKVSEQEYHTSASFQNARQNLVFLIETVL